MQSVGEAKVNWKPKCLLTMEMRDTEAEMGPETAASHRGYKQLFAVCVSWCPGEGFVFHVLTGRKKHGVMKGHTGTIQYDLPTKMRNANALFL